MTRQAKVRFSYQGNFHGIPKRYGQRQPDRKECLVSNACDFTLFSFTGGVIHSNEERNAYEKYDLVRYL